MRAVSVDLGLFDQVADALQAMVSPDLGELRTAPRRWGIKVWFDDEQCPREHYEAQVVGPRHVPAAEVLAIEVGFHAEHPTPADNDDAIAPLLAQQAAWRSELGTEPEIDEFLGRTGWRRVSETWLDPDLADPELCFELADRLAHYLESLEPHRRA